MWQLLQRADLDYVTRDATVRLARREAMVSGASPAAARLAGIEDAMSHARAAVAIAEFAGTPDRRRLLELAAADLERLDPRDAMNVLWEMATAASGLDADGMRHFFDLVTSRASSSRRDMAAATLGAWTPVLGRLGGNRSVQEMFRALRDVSRWWP